MYINLPTDKVDKKTMKVSVMFVLLVIGVIMAMIGNLPVTAESRGGKFIFYKS